jgi:ESS family glutamate:Na+ symporter
MRRKIPLLDRLDIPAPIAGGMVYALLALALRDRVVNIEADTSLRDLAMIAFMTTIGLSASVQLLRASGRAVIVMLSLASGGAVLQNLLGMGIARAMGQDLRLGIMAGSAALAGGPATAVAFGTTFEKLGMPGATAVGMASATFGIAVAGLTGGYIGGWLIRRGQLRGTSSQAEAPSRNSGVDPTAALPRMVLIIGVSMGLGSLLSAQFEHRGWILPSYIGAMIAAGVIRNLDDRFHFAGISQPDVDTIGRIVLPLFIVMALITLQKWRCVGCCA